MTIVDSNDYLDNQNELVLPKKLTYWQAMSTEAFLRLWTFLCTYGERFHFDPRLDAVLEPKRQHGRCIMQAQVDVKNWRNHEIQKHHSGTLLDYAEGLCSVAPFSLHAWAVYLNTRHGRVFDRTWAVDASKLETIWYQGVVFDDEFFNWVRFQQRAIQYRDTLPYLVSGSCCLTYAPLLNGQLADYPIKEEHRDFARQQLVAFHDAVIDYKKSTTKTEVPQC